MNKDVLNQAPLIVAGHSHIVCFGVPNSKDGSINLVELRTEPLVYGIAAPMPRPDDFIARICAMSAGKRLAILYSGWDQLLFASTEVVDFCCSVLPNLPLDTSAIIVPEDLVRTHDTMYHFPADLRKAFTLLRDSGVDDMVVLCPPPPKGDNEKIRALIANGSALAQLISSKGIDLRTAPMTPPLIRLKLWALVGEMYKEAAIAVGATFVEPPAETRDEFGYLKEKFWSDATHANDAYGTLYLNHVLKEIYPKF